eukprot:CAMPEP_0178437688 /NCGR_PEP_ID=MMETSP0689_2-20121128/35147_1 /TAXON_ID=160604 /ORGANISM="Amphidinium massartii, Strain CS-259" /LENGTH=549 /DNA_ID=CAMNT_0020059949 /DNA_START=121 /DNA_END=1770 /DNA_ORIENTATION=-
MDYEGSDLGDDFDDEMAQGEEPIPEELPEGVEKEIVTEAPGENFQTPKAGDEVSVHYVGTLAADGSEFDSSRSRGKPFTFTLGQGQVIKGWDLGVASMKKGEVAKFTLAPEFAYGEAGSPPKIPENATLVFEVELLSWVSKDDLFQDGGAIKSKVEDGKGWQKPKAGSEVRISMKVCAKDGSTIDEKTGFEYVLGTDALGPLGKAIDKALEGMKRQEKIKLALSKDYAYGDEKPDGADVELTLESIYEIKDISFTKDKSVMKKDIDEGLGYERAKDGVSITLKVESITDGGGTALPGFTAKDITFKRGDGEVCDVLEMAACEMRKNEKAIVTCLVPATCVEPQLGLSEIKAEKVVLKIECLDFESGKDTYAMSGSEKIEYAEARKAVGGGLFKKERYALAQKCYKAVSDLFGYVGDMDEELKQKAEDLKKVCYLNSAACQLQLKDYAAAKSSCNEVLTKESGNEKATYRRAQAELGLKNFPECIKDLKNLLLANPENKEARRLLKEAGEKQKLEDKKVKGMYAKMCAGLGKGKLPETPVEEAPFVPEDE